MPSSLCHYITRLIYNEKKNNHRARKSRQLLICVLHSISSGDIVLTKKLDYEQQYYHKITISVNDGQDVSIIIDWCILLSLLFMSLKWIIWPGRFYSFFSLGEIKTCKISLTNSIKDLSREQHAYYYSNLYEGKT